MGRSGVVVSGAVVAEVAEVQLDTHGTGGLFRQLLQLFANLCGRGDAVPGRVLAFTAVGLAGAGAGAV